MKTLGLLSFDIFALAKITLSFMAKITNYIFLEVIIMFATYDEMKSNHEVVKTFCAQHRYGLTVVAGILAEQNGLANRDDYIKFMNDLTIDEFTGNYLTALFNPMAVVEYIRVCNAEIGFYYFVEKHMGKDVRDAVQKYIEEH